MSLVTVAPACLGPAPPCLPPPCLPPCLAGSLVGPALGFAPPPRCSSMVEVNPFIPQVSTVSIPQPQKPRNQDLSTVSLPQPQKPRNQETMPPPMPWMPETMPPPMAWMPVPVPRQVSVAMPPPCAPPKSLWPSFPAHQPKTPRGGLLEVEDLYFDGAFFDPVQEPARGLLLSKMRLQPNARLEPMRGGLGSSNAGLWVLQDSCQSFVLKLVRSGLSSPLSEADKFARLTRDFPGIAQDPSLAFPCKIFNIITSSGERSQTLVVMRQVNGLRVSDIIMQKLHSRQPQELMHILHQFGAFLADFHARYKGMQHGDLTPANVFYNPANGRFTLVDVADLAPRNPVIQSDSDRFVSSLKLLSCFYGQHFFMEGKARFEAGYATHRSRISP